MAYSRYRLRGALLEALEKIPDQLRPENIPQLADVLSTVNRLRRELAKNPFEYVDGATRKEHGDLAKIFVQLSGMLVKLNGDALDSFRLGHPSMSAGEQVEKLRGQLRERVQGTSGTAMLLAKFFKGGELQPED